MTDDDLDRRIRTYGSRWRDAHPFTNDLDTPRLARGSRRRTGAAILTAAVVVATAIGIAAEVQHRGPSAANPVAPSSVSTKTTNPTSSALAFDVPWVDRPSSLTAALPTTTLPPTNARPCTASDVSISPDFSEAAGSTTLVTGYDFTNTSPTTCMLGGFPAVVATEPGLPPVVAEHTRLKEDLPPGNVPPGKFGILVVYTPLCGSVGVASTLPARVYHHLVVTLPGGGQTEIGADFDLSCGGMSTDPLGLRQPPPALPTWFSSLTSTITAPQSVRAGSTLVYVVSLRNTTTHSVELTPCPVYIESVIGANVVIKDVYALNCDRVHAIPAKGSVRYEMRAPIASNATTGEATIGWGVVEGGVNGSRAIVHVVHGSDIESQPTNPH